MDFDGKLKGFHDFDKLLSELPNRVENKVLQGAAMGAARVGLKSIKSAAPVSAAFQSAASKKYGSLKNNLRVRPSRLNRKKGMRGAFITTGKSFWGYFLEKGTRYIAARPWFAPAFARVHDAMLKEMVDRLRVGITREALKGKK